MRRSRAPSHRLGVSDPMKLFRAFCAVLILCASSYGAMAEMVGPGGSNKITGGTINNTPIGATTPSTGAFTNLRGVGFDVVSYGADPTGSADSDPGFAAAETAACAAGATRITVPGGSYKFNSTFSIGDGTGSSVSTCQGLLFVGEGTPTFGGIFAGYGSTDPVTITWGGSVGGTMVKIAGPLQGWGLQNIDINCGGTAAIGLDVVSGQNADNRSLSVRNCTSWQVKEEVVATFGSVTNTSNLHGTWNKTQLVVPVGGTGGALLTGNTTQNTDFQVWTDTYITMLGTAADGLYLQAAAGNVFLGLHFAGAGSNSDIVFDYGLLDAWPSENLIMEVEPGTGDTFVSKSGSPGGTAKPNRIYGLIQEDGATYPTLANLVTDAAFQSKLAEISIDLSDPIGTTSTATLKMMGLGSSCSITPVNNTRIAFSLVGSLTNNTTNDGVEAQLMYGTGTAPANGDAQTGTRISGTQSVSNIGTGGNLVPLNISGDATGLTPGTAYWCDLAVAAV